MYNSIQYFVEKVISQIEKKREKFMENPTEFGNVVVEFKEVLTGCRCLPFFTLSSSLLERTRIWKNQK